MNDVSHALAIGMHKEKSFTTYIFGIYLSNFKHNTTKIWMLSDTMPNLRCSIKV